jgi:NarL family two-component system response regulator LiaR
MTDSRRIRVIIVDDHNMVRKGLVVLLEDFEDLQIVAEAGDGEYAVNLCRNECPDVVLMDMMMPRMDGIVATQKIREICSETQVVALTSFSDGEHVQAALKAGAIGYIMKDISGDELANAIRRASEGVSQCRNSAERRIPIAKHPADGQERIVLPADVDERRKRRSQDERMWRMFDGQLHGDAGAE